MDVHHLKIKVDADWLALNIYRLALEQIVAIADTEPFNSAIEDVGEIARGVLKQFPGSGK